MTWTKKQRLGAATLWVAASLTGCSAADDGGSQASSAGGDGVEFVLFDTGSSSQGEDAASSTVKDTSPGADTGAPVADSAAVADAGAKVCAPGSTQLCYCSASAQGVQICSPAGTTWLPCQCEEPQDAGVAVDTASEDSSDAAADGGTPPDDGCSDRAKQVYVLADDSTLLRFKPDKLVFEVVGKLSCNVPAATPFSMSVDRQANAWVLYQKSTLSGGGAGLFEVSTKDASCKPTAYMNNQMGYSLFGMGFSSNGIGTKDETLYIAGGSATSWNFAKGNLGSIGMPSLQVSHHAVLDMPGGSPELTGDGNGKLWGFFPNTLPPSVREIDKATGKTLNPISIPSSAMQNVQAWAFARWGGKFYLFFKSQSDPSSAVFQIDEKNTVTKAIASTGYNIVGAGVSSCAPTTAVAVK